MSIDKWNDILTAISNICINHHATTGQDLRPQNFSPSTSSPSRPPPSEVPTCKFCLKRGHTEENCWKKDPSKRRSRQINSTEQPTTPFTPFDETVHQPTGCHDSSSGSGSAAPGRRPRGSRGSQGSQTLHTPFAASGGLPP